jgi:hypothetical protein
MQTSNVMPDNTDVQSELIQALRVHDNMPGARASLQPIANVGWDNPQWYEWAWNRVPFAPRGQVEIAEPAVGVMRGVYPVQEREGIPYRWTIDRADFRVLLPGARGVALRLRADQDKPVQVYVDREPLQTIQVGPTWSDYKLPLNQPTDGPIVIELRVPTQVVSVDEPYARGVAVARLQLTATP